MSGLDAHLVVERDPAFRLDIEIRIESGRTAALLGPNGAGKSTAVDAIAGLVALDAGALSLDGRPLDVPTERVFVPAEQRQVGVVFQDYVLFPHLTVVDNIAFGLIASGAGRSAARQRAHSVLERFDLDGLGHRSPRELSGGQAQRVALARALVTAPKLLLLDEPLAALDVATRFRLRRVLADHLAEFDGPRLLITHDPTEAFVLADEIHVIEGGRVTQVGTPDDIRLRPRTPYVADIAGANLLFGSARGGVLGLDGHSLAIADTSVDGEVLATIQPQAISLHRRQPEGSPRNAWRTVITHIEHYGDRVRVQVGDPVQMTAEVTPGAERDLDLAEGDQLWVSIKATEITVTAGRIAQV